MTINNPIPCINIWLNLKVTLETGEQHITGYNNFGIHKGSWWNIFTYPYSWEYTGESQFTINQNIPSIILFNTHPSIESIPTSYNPLGCDNPHEAQVFEDEALTIPHSKLALTIGPPTSISALNNFTVQSIDYYLKINNQTFYKAKDDSLLNFNIIADINSATI